MMFWLLISLFPLSWGLRIIHKSSSVCGQRELKNSEGELFSPGYPHGYPNDTTCTWMIFTPKSVLLSIHIIDLDIEENDDILCNKRPCCTQNWLSISVDTLGWPSGNSQAIESLERRHCGTNASVYSIQLSQRITIITFHSAQQIDSSRRGFRLIYRTSVTKCERAEFRCTDFFCVDERSRCDGKADCADGSDEENCISLFGHYCPHPQVPCGTRASGCYDNITQRCDGRLDCVNGLDEMGCDNCRSNELRCRAGHECYQFSQACDGRLDCPFGDDEIGCLQSDDCISKIPCINQIGCYSLNQQCDGTTDCDDESDEKGCSLSLPPCPRGPRCSNGICITADQWCNGQIDCGDRSDESNCARQSSLQNSVIAAAIMGSLVCGLLLVMAVGCFCRLYSMRMANVHFRLSHDAMSQFANTGPSPHPMSMVGGASHLPAPLEEEFWHREPPPAYSVAVGLPPSIIDETIPRSSRLFTIAQSSMRPPRLTRSARTRRSQGSQAAPPSMNNTVIIRPRPRPRALPNRTSGFVCPTTSATSMVPLGIPSSHRQQIQKSDKYNNDNDIGIDDNIGVTNIDHVNPTSSYGSEINNQCNIERLVLSHQSSISSDNQSDVSPSRTSTTSLVSVSSETQDDICDINDTSNILRT